MDNTKKPLHFIPTDAPCPKTKCADFRMKSAAYAQTAHGCLLQQEIARRCKYTIAGFRE